MKRIIAFLALALAASPAAADPIDTSQILSAASGDINRDGKPDLVMLVNDPDKGAVDIHVLMEAEDQARLMPIAVVHDKVWGSAEPGGFVGREPSVEILANGSIAVHSKNDAIGRDRWNQTLIVAWRNNDLVVAGFRHEYYDTLDPDNNGACDLNVLTGKGDRNGKAIKAGARFIPLSDWQDEMGAKPCGIGE